MKPVPPYVLTLMTCILHSQEEVVDSIPPGLVSRDLMEFQLRVAEIAPKIFVWVSKDPEVMEYLVGWEADAESQSFLKHSIETRNAFYQYAKIAQLNIRFSDWLAMGKPES